MLRWIGDSLKFLYWLGVLHLARLVVVSFCIAEVVTIFALWGVAFVEWEEYDKSGYFLMPIGAMLLVVIQVALWQFMWLRIAQRGDKGRVLAEWFTQAARYPVVREPHAWE